MYLNLHVPKINQANINTYSIKKIKMLFSIIIDNLISYYRWDTSSHIKASMRVKEDEILSKKHLKD